MKAVRQRVLEWAEQGLIESGNLPAALQAGGALPGPAAWRDFLDRYLLGLGVLMLGSGVMFLFAYNWNDLGRFTRFGMLEAAILCTLAAFWKLDVNSLPGKAAVNVLALLVGVLLAFVGQTYQTGADTFELFAVWSVLILPWVLVSRSVVLWLFWILLLNLSLYLYYLSFRGFFWALFDASGLWTLFALNTAAWASWALAAGGGIPWLQKPWALRLLATASGSLLTLLAIQAVLDAEWGGLMRTGLIWAGWLSAVYIVYRKLYFDAYMLASGVLSVVLVVTALMGKITLSAAFDAGGFLLTGLTAVALSALGTHWLRLVLREGAPDES